MPDDLIIPDAFILGVLARIYDTTDVKVVGLDGKEKEAAAINWLSACNLIDYHKGTGDVGNDYWQCTPKGKFLVEYMLRTKMPMMRWEIPASPEATSEPTN